VQGCCVSEVIAYSHAVVNLWIVEPVKTDI